MKVPSPEEILTTAGKVLMLVTITPFIVFALPLWAIGRLFNIKGG